MTRADVPVPLGGDDAASPYGAEAPADKPFLLVRFRWLALALLLPLGACGYNRIQSLDEQAGAAQSQIEVQLQRRPLTPGPETVLALRVG